MFEQRPGLQRVFRLIVSLAVIAIPFAIYATAYVDSRHNYFVSQNFRTLNEVGTQLTSLFENFEKQFFSSEVKSDEKLVELTLEIVEKTFPPIPPKVYAKNSEKMNLTEVKWTDYSKNDGKKFGIALRWTDYLKNDRVKKFGIALREAFKAEDKAAGYQKKIQENRGSDILEKKFRSAKKQADKAWTEVADTQNEALKAVGEKKKL